MIKFICLKIFGEMDRLILKEVHIQHCMLSEFCKSSATVAIKNIYDVSLNQLFVNAEDCVVSSNQAILIIPITNQEQ